jgi:glucosamine--fructose-6-phosphate aminotransferase (isomerizing)
MAHSILFQEIHQQPGVISELLANETNAVNKIARAIRRKFKYVVIAARGTSDNAARYAQYLFGVHNQLQVALATPSLFTMYDSPPNLSGALVVGISQSGQSPDIVSVLAEGKRQGCPTLAITNDPLSPLAQTADFLVPLHAGEEKAVAATKTYTASLAALAMLSCALLPGGDRLEQLHLVPQKMETTLTNLSGLMQRSERYRFMEHCAVIGRGFNYATAFEIALKIKELTRIVAEPYSSADFRHGPIATVTQGFPVILVAPTGAVSHDMLELIESLKERNAELIVISDDRPAFSSANFYLPVPSGLPEWLSPLISVLAGQLFALYLAEARGLNPDQPAGLHKVTETR